MKTDEAQWKERVKKLFKEFGEQLYYHMPVQNGMGSPTLDFICCWKGRYFAVETKDKNKDLTPRQFVTTNEILLAGGTVFRVRCQQELNTLRHWLNNPFAGPHYFYTDVE